MAKAFIWLMACSTALLLGSQATPDDAVREVWPYLTFLLFFQLLPLFWIHNANVFSPPAFAGVYGALGTTSALSYFLQHGVRLGYTSGLAQAEAVSLVTTTVSASCLGLAGYYFGYFNPAWGKKLATAFPDVVFRGWNPTRLARGSAIIGLIFLISYGFFQFRLGVPLWNISELGAGKAVWREDPTLSWMMRGSELGTLPALFYFARALQERNRTQMLLAGAALALLALLLLRIGQRGFLYSVPLAGVIIFNFLRRRVPISFLAIAIFTGVVTNSIMLRWRVDYMGAAPTWTEAITQPVAVMADHERDRRRFAASALLFHEFPARYDYLLGESWAGLVGSLIPRWLWPEKVAAFEWRDTNIMNKLAGAPVPTPYLGVLYVNFSYIGIFIGMLGWGIVQRAQYEWMRRRPGDPNRVLLYYATLSVSGPTLLFISSLLQSAVPMILLLRYISPRQRAMDATP